MMHNIPNIINKDGIALYHSNVLSDEEIIYYFDELFNNIAWEHERVVMFGKEITTKRKVAFFSDPNMSYTYSNKTKQGMEWTPALLRLKNRVEAITGSSYNACLLNLYHNGEEGMGWHCDDEKEIVPNSSIASLSLGAERNFSFKHKTTKETISLVLENGSILDMKGEIQKYWLHALPKTKKVIAPRINLTFRQMQMN
jgi:alkylated DNA repair dioxygenase AlkB